MDTFRQSNPSTHFFVKWWNITRCALAAGVCAVAVGCGPPTLSELQPASAKTSVWVGINGSPSGWEMNTVSNAIVQDGAIPMIQTFSNDASGQGLAKALKSYHADLYIWVQNSGPSKALETVISSHENQRVELVVPETLNLAGNVGVRSVSPGNSGYLLGYLAGLVATDMNDQQIGVLAGGTVSASRTEIQAALVGVDAANSAIQVQPAVWTNHSFGSAASGTGNNPPVNGTGNNASGSAGSWPPATPLPVTRVVLALRPLTSAEWQTAQTAGTLIVSLVGDTDHANLIGGPIAPSFAAVESDVQKLVQSQWKKGSSSVHMDVPVYVKSAALQATSMAAYSAQEQAMSGTSLNVGQAWNTLPSALRSQWGVWINASQTP